MQTADERDRERTSAKPATPTPHPADWSHPGVPPVMDRSRGESHLNGGLLSSLSLEEREYLLGLFGELYEAGVRWRTYRNPMRVDGLFVAEDKPFEPYPGVRGSGGELPYPAVPFGARSLGYLLPRYLAEALVELLNGESEPVVSVGSPFVIGDETPVGKNLSNVSSESVCAGRTGASGGDGGTDPCIDPSSGAIATGGPFLAKSETTEGRTIR